MSRNRFIKGRLNAELSEQIIRECGLNKWSSVTQLIAKMYHVDTYFHNEGDTVKWRPQGYVYVKDLCDTDINIGSGEIATMDDEFILFFTLHLPLAGVK